jgi:hypothetical protein
MATTPYMGLILPVVSTTIGPDWATYLNTALTAVDSHTHASGKGLPVPTAGIWINADLGFGSYNATALRSARFTSQAAALALAADVACVYVVNGDLYYNNGAGAQIRVTSGTSLNASAVGGIGGDYVVSGASVFYTSATKLFSFQSVTSPAGSILWSAMAHGPLTVYDTAAGLTKGVTLKSPVGLAAAYSLTLPAALPASTLPLLVDATGATSLAQLLNAQQNFGTPSAVTDVAIKSYVDTQDTAIGKGAKAWAILTLGAAGAVTVTAGYNVASAAYAATNLTVTFTNAAPSANYAISAFPGNAGWAATAAYGTTSTQGTTSFVLQQATAAPVVVNWASGQIVHVLAFW